jgi:lysophospholipase L1-like esterase
LAVACQVHPSGHRRPDQQAPAQVPALAGLPAGATVLFLGDSITWHNHYCAFIESHFTLRHPGLRLRFVNRGMRGDTAGGALDRLERDVLPHDPDVVVVLLGMNDGGQKGYRRALLRRYLENMERLVAALRERTRARVVLATSTCVDPAGGGTRGYNRMLGAMAGGLVGLGRKLRVPVINLFEIFSNRLAEARAAAPPVELMQDAIHPGPAGHLVIAHAMLRRFDPGFTGRLVLEHPDDALWARDARALYDLLQERWRLGYYLWDPKELGADALQDVWPGARPMSPEAARRRLREVEARIESLRSRKGDDG